MTNEAEAEQKSGGKLWCLSEVDIFCDLNEAEMAAIAEAAPMKRLRAGSGWSIYGCAGASRHTPTVS